MHKKTFFLRSRIPNGDNSCVSESHAQTGPIEGFTLETTTTQDGRAVLSFPFMAISDLHWGTKYSRAKRTTHMLRHIQTDRLDMVGDVIDGDALMKKKRWNFGPWHRQAMAEVLRMTHNGTQTNIYPGNHDEALRGRPLQDGGRRFPGKLSGKSLYGVRFCEDAVYAAPDGRRFLITHGDLYDNHLFTSLQSRAFWYAVGGHAYDALNEVDYWINKIPLCREFSIAAAGKRAAKIVINRFLGIRAQMAREIDSRMDCDGAIYGHSHMGGFERTPGGKLLINDGCCTEYVQALVHDRQGRFALLTWRKDRLDVTTEDGREQSVSWAALGLAREFERPMVLREDAFTARADRVMRLIYRMWPARDRQAYAEDKRREVASGGTFTAPPRPAMPIPRMA